MHRAIWAVKRAHWKTWAVGLRMLRKVGITPARLDVIHCLSLNGGAMSQKALQLALGVVRSTMSEALAKLEKLGMVRRGPRTRRGRRVTLTEKAARLEGPVYSERMLADCQLDETLGDELTSWGRTIVLERLCRRVRLAFGDPSRGALFGWLSYEP